MEIVDQMELESFFGLRYGVSFADFLVNSIVSCKKKNRQIWSNRLWYNFQTIFFPSIIAE